MPREFRSSSTYVVKRGDTLSDIAKAHDVALNALVAANAGIVTDPNVIRVGWELLIPGELGQDPVDPPSGTAVEEYIVRRGDTLAVLARQWGTTVAAIAELNGIANPNLISVGQRIRKPGSTGMGSATTDETPPVRDRNLVFTRWPLDLPPARISGGYREDYGGYLHRGIDIAGVPVGTPVVAPAAGIARTHRPGDGWGSGSFGNCVILDHPGTPWWSIYAHMDEIRCRDGQSIAAGQVIGTVGFTGRVVPAGPAGAHLHWQLSDHMHFPPDFQYIANPLDFLER